jgi:hypothetical protein
MFSARTILSRLKSLQEYLNTCPRNKKSAYFEMIITEAFSHILYLPFFSSDNNEIKIPHHVFWRGSKIRMSNAPGGGADTIAYCYNYYLLIETTRDISSDQWRRELSQATRHYSNFRNNKSPTDIYVILVCTKLHHDTWRSIRINPDRECRIIPIELPTIITMLETSILAFTLRHLEIRELLNKIRDISLKSLPTIDDFHKEITIEINNWQKNVLNMEKIVFTAVKSYEAMRKIGRNYVGVSEILIRLKKHPIVQCYFNKMGYTLDYSLIEESLIYQGLACCVGAIPDGEKLFSPVPLIDLIKRNERFIKTVSRI